MLDYKYNLKLEYVIEVIARHFNELPESVRKKFVGAISSNKKSVSLKKSQIEGFLKDNFNELPEDCKEKLNFAWGNTDEINVLA